MKYDKNSFDTAIRESACIECILDSIFLRSDSLLILSEASYAGSKLDSQVKILTESGTRRDLLNLYMEAEEASIDKKTSIIQRMGAAIQTVINKIKNFINDKILVHLSKNTSIEYIEVPEHIPTLYEKIKAAMAVIGGNIKKLAQKAVNGFKNIDVGWAAVALVAAIAAVKGYKIYKKVEKTVNTVNNAAEKIGDRAKEAGNAVVQTAKQIGDGAKAVGDTAKELNEKRKETTKAAAGFIKLKADKAVEMAKDINNNVLGVCDTALNSIKDNTYVKKVLSSEQVKGFSLNKFTGCIKEITKASNTFVGAVMTGLKKDK